MGRIAAIGDLAAAPAARRLDVAGLAVAPGFIDSHAHDDRAVLDMPDMLPKVSQGVTTVVNGNCGISLAPLRGKEPLVPPLNLLGRGDSYASFAAYRQAIDAAAPAVNVAAMVGHSTLRVMRMADVARPATAAEIDAMRRDVEQALNDGALGVSTGTFYPRPPPRRRRNHRGLRAPDAARRHLRRALCGTKAIASWTPSTKACASAPP